MEYIASKNKTKEIMEKYHMYFKKKYGQNFLIDKNIIDKIIKNAGVTKEDIVIEIGPGLGNMTQYLADAAKKVYAIEIDKQLVEILRNDTLSSFENIEIISDDILKVDLKSFFAKLREESRSKQNIKIVSNLPYYITTPIIMEMLKYREQLDSITIMIQKEVAKRIDASPKSKDYGALTIAIQVFCDTSYITTVSRNCFIPEPNVDSAVIKLDILERPKIELYDEELYFKIVKAAFSQRRKTLVNTLNSNFSIFEDKDEIANILEELKLPKTVRGEELTIEQFEELARKIKANMINKK